MRRILGSSLGGSLSLDVSDAENRDKQGAISREVRSSAVQLATCEGAVLCNTPVDNTNCRFTLRMYVWGGITSSMARILIFCCSSYFVRFQLLY